MMKRRYTGWMIAGAMLAAAGFCGAQSTAPGEAPRESHDSAVAKNLLIFNELVTQLENTYVDSIRTDEAFEAAIGAMLNTVDPYTEYYPTEEKDALLRMTTGAYGGIGSFIMTRDGNTYILEPIMGSPAQRAGLKAGDMILRIDTTDMRGIGSDRATKYLRGEPGSKVEVTVQRPFVADSILTFSVVRERVQEKSVPYFGVIDGNTGYIRLNSFMEKSGEEVREALESFKKDNAIEGIILDLRGNGGGLVESAIDILGNFLPKGTEVLQTRGKTPSSDKTFKTTHQPLFPDMPLAILIDGGSASASEITAGALQDLDRAVLVGSRSFGKGLVQSTMPLPYNGLLKVTTAKYYIPSGRLIQAMDYSHRNPDGSVARTPDSLTNEFRTRNGRTVRDGGGLQPDTVVNEGETSRLVYNLMFNRQIFDYATKFAATHPTIPPAGEFVVTDEIFADFVENVDTAKVYTDKIGITMVKDMREVAAQEGFDSEELTAALDALIPLVEPNLRRDLYKKREDISLLLGQEITSRYYGAAGETEFENRDDEAVKTAVAILRNRQLYDRMTGKAKTGGR